MRLAGRSNGLFQSLALQADMLVELLLKIGLSARRLGESRRWDFEFSAAGCADSSHRSTRKPFRHPNITLRAVHQSSNIPKYSG
jgi:hypothetical protein